MNALHALRKMFAALALGAALASAPALAQVPDRVGRIAYLAGDVQFYSESAQAWQPAQLNAPVSSRNSLFTGTNGRAEVRFGSTAVALDAQTQLDIQVLDDASFRAGVPRGSISLRVRQIEADESLEVKAPAATYNVLQAGRLRVDADDSGSSVTVLAGLVNASVTGGSSVMVEAGQGLSAASGGFARSAARTSALDSWAAQRDNGYRSSEATRYVSPNMTGYEELDANGRWVSDADYGKVWYPTTYVTDGWVPYRDGHWAFVAPWGWTWVDAAPWGFAPFHYGRWVLIGSRWAWMPGTYVRRPSYAPALVGFVGGSTAAVSISIGTQPAVGWYPLPPWERYRPAYAHHDRQLQTINNFSISTPPASAWRTVERNRVSVNQVQGATVVPRQAFVDSQPVRRAALSVAAPVLAAPAVASVPVAAPVRLGAAPPSASGRPEFGERRSGREPDQWRAERGRGSPEVSNGVVAPARSAEALPQVAPAGVPAGVNSGQNSGPRIFRSESRGNDRQPSPAVVMPQAREAAPLPRVESSPPRQSVQSFGSAAESSDASRSRHEGGQRSVAAPAVAEPVQPARPPAVHAEPRAEPRAEPKFERRIDTRVLEPQAVQRVEPRVEPRSEPRIEQRPEQRHEPRQMQRVEPAPPVHAPAAPPPAQPQPQPERRAPEPEHERHSHGQHDKER